MDKTDQKLSFEVSIENVSYALKSKSTQHILKQNTGTFRPGKLTAILGPFGSGKTPLLKTVAGWSKHKPSGTILVNGRKISSDQMAKISCFDSQNEHFHPLATVKEELEMAELLKSGYTNLFAPQQQKSSELIQMLGLAECKDTVIGEDNNMAISTEEKKGMGIGMELLGDRPIIFVDEPTSGLDSRSAYLLLPSLKQKAQEGATVVITMDQPTQKDFELFDDVVLMVDGYVVYWGEKENIVPYFKGLGYPDQTTPNGAEYFFYTVLGLQQNMENSQSQANAPILSEYWKRQQAPFQKSETTFTFSKAPFPPFFPQFLFLFKRRFKTLLREKKVIYLHLFNFIFTLLPLIFFFTISRGKNDIPKLIVLYAILFITPLYITAIACNTFPSQRKNYIHESHTGYYNCLSYYLANMSFDIMSLCLPVFISSSIMVILCKNNPESFICDEIPILSAAAFIPMSITHTISIISFCYIFTIGVQNRKIPFFIPILYWIIGWSFLGFLISKNSYKMKSVNKTVLWTFGWFFLPFGVVFSGFDLKKKDFDFKLYLQVIPLPIILFTLAGALLFFSTKKKILNYSTER